MTATRARVATAPAQAAPPEQEKCANCSLPIERVPAIWRVAEGTRRRTTEEIARFGAGDSEWFHVDGDRACAAAKGRRWTSAEPLTTCPRCKARGTLVTDMSGAWGDETTCNAPGCDYRYFFSIGD